MPSISVPWPRLQSQLGVTTRTHGGGGPSLLARASALIKNGEGDSCMTVTLTPEQPVKQARAALMRALVFRGPGEIAVADVPKPKAGPGQALIRVTLTTICGTDVHIMRGEYP